MSYALSGIEIATEERRQRSV